MKLADVLEPATTVEPDESLTHIISKMLSEKRTEIFVSGKKVKIVSSMDIIKKSIGDPQKMRISSFAKPVKIFTGDEPPEKLIDYMLITEYRTLAFKKSGKLYALPKHKLLKFIDMRIFEKRRTGDIVHMPFCARTNDTLASVKSAMKNLGLSRIPVVDEQERCVGVIDVLDILKLVKEKSRVKFGERSGEKIRLGDVKVSPLFEEDTTRVKSDMSLKDLINLMYSKGVYTVVVEDDERFLGIITIRDILKLIGKSGKTIYMRISGLDEEDEFVKSKVNELVNRSIERLLKFVNINYIVINVDIYRKTGKRMKYSVHGRFVTNKGSFYASCYDWNPVKALRIFLEKIERVVLKKVKRF